MTASLLTGSKGCSNQCPTCKCGPRPSDKWIPWYIVAFFVLIVGALGYMAYIAVSTEPGVITSDAYQKGLNYDRIISESNAADAIPWQINVTTRAENKATVLAVKLYDGSRKPLNNAVVECWWVRPAQDGKDRHWIMQQKDDGLYEASGQLLAKGAWDVHITVAQGAEQKQFVKSLVIE